MLRCTTGWWFRRLLVVQFPLKLPARQWYSIHFRSVLRNRVTFDVKMNLAHWIDPSYSTTSSPEFFQIFTVFTCLDHPQESSKVALGEIMAERNPYCGKAKNKPSPKSSWIGGYKLSPNDGSDRFIDVYSIGRTPHCLAGSTIFYHGFLWNPWKTRTLRLRSLWREETSLGDGLFSMLETSGKRHAIHGLILI
jgi:hypothetical protein